MSKICAHCGKEIEDHYNFCSYCGSKIPEKRFCHKCGKELPLQAVFCSKCGERVKEEDSQATPINTNNAEDTSEESVSAAAPIPVDDSIDGNDVVVETNSSSFAAIGDSDSDSFIKRIVRTNPVIKIGAPVLSVIAIAALYFFAGNHAVESTAKDAVNDLLQENIASVIEDLELDTDQDFKLSKCVKVELGEKVSDNTYHATAYLENGHTFGITVRKIGDSIEVTM